MKMLTELGGWDLQITSVIYLTNKDTGKKRKLATVKPADGVNFPDKTQPFNIKEIVEVNTYFEGDVSTFYFSKYNLLPTVWRQEVLHSPTELEEFFQEALVTWQTTTLDKFLTSFSSLVQLWEAAPSLFGFKRIE